VPLAPLCVLLQYLQPLVQLLIKFVAASISHTFELGVFFVLVGLVARQPLIEADFRL
jgi:hypothetical protein